MSDPYIVDFLLGRKGFVEDQIDVTVVGNELVTLPFVTSEFCAALIYASEASGQFGMNPHDPVPALEVSIKVLSPLLFDRIQEEVGRRVWPQLTKQWPVTEYFGLNDAFVVKYRKGEQEELRLHHDVAQLSGSVKLNDSYSGAELEFPRQNYSNSLLPVGTLLVWPGLVTHPHRSAPIQSGTKYSLTLWFELPLQLM